MNQAAEGDQTRKDDRRLPDTGGNPVKRASLACSATTPSLPASRIAGFGMSSSIPPFHDQVFRNQSVRRTCNGAGAGPRLCAVIRTRMSSGAAFAYSTKTSK
jgi:hypothetical protein